MRKTDDEFLKDIYKKEKEYRDKQRKRKKQIITITLSSAICVAAAFAIFTPYRNLKTGGNGTASISEEQLDGNTDDITEYVDTDTCDAANGLPYAVITFENGEQKLLTHEDYESLRSLIEDTESPRSSKSSKKDLGESDDNNRSEVFSNSSVVFSVFFKDENDNVSQYTIDGNCLTDSGTNSEIILSDTTLQQIINIIYGD